MKEKIKYIISTIVWILIWQVLSQKVGRQVFLPSPLEVVHAFFRIARMSFFYRAIVNSLFHVCCGFFLAVLAGIIVAVLSFCSSACKAFLTVPLKLIQSTPVASFTILALVWVSSKYLSILISFLMVLPVVAVNIEQGLSQIDKKLFEMASVYQMSVWRKIKYIFIPAVMPSFLSACSVGVGMAWKSGVAAEVIGIAKPSIGNELYQAKLYLMTPELFAWTFSVIFISVFAEYVVVTLVKMLQKRLERE